ncbi:MAG: transglutaminase-like domain-containing protein, partial [Acidimicrobiales bacterium]
VRRSAVSAAARLDELLGDPDAGLDRILAVIASIDDEPPDEAHIVTEFDRLADEAPDDGSPDSLLDYVHGVLGFTGDVADYYNPANSLIHRVLSRRRGIPLTLAAVAAEVGRRRGVDLRPIGMPGHILLGEGPEPTQWFDPFNRGAGLGYDDCRTLFSRFHPVEAFTPAMLRPIGHQAVAIRTLNNLRVAYARLGQVARMIPVLELRAAMASAGPTDQHELVNALVGLGRYDRAAEVLEKLADIDHDRAPAYRARVRAMRAHRN